MLAMRSWAESDLRKALKYEKILSDLFTGLSELELKEKVNSGLEFYLEQSYGQLTALYSEALRHMSEPPENKRTDNHFLSMFKGMGEAPEELEGHVFDFFKRRIREESLKLFYQSFWHGLFPLWIKTTFYANLQSVGFNLEPIPESFLSLLACLIFKESFEEGDLSVNVA
jgi:hypothetical protein